MITAHVHRAHAKLAPSAAHRWIECPGSVRLSEGVESKSSSYAAEGSAAHELAAHCLTDNVQPGVFLGRTINLLGENVGERFGLLEPDGETRFEVTDEMVDAVDTYLGVVRSLLGRRPETVADLDVEQRLDMRHIHPEIFGTGDAVVYQHNTNWLHVIDFKYGKGVVVDPRENPQLMLYGAGAARRYHNRAVDRIELHIVQPRAAGEAHRTWPTDIIYLLEFEDELRAAAMATEQPDALLKAGEWCRFCPAAGFCPALRERATRTALAEFDDTRPLAEQPVEELEAMSPERLAKILSEAEMIGNWLKAVQAFAHAEATAGRMPTGYKLVAKRATRKWKDPDAALDRLMVEGFGKDEIYEEPKMKSVAQMEATVGKKAFGGYADLVVKESSGTNLVLETDARPSVKANALAEFGPIVET